MSNFREKRKNVKIKTVSHKPYIQVIQWFMFVYKLN